MDIGRAITFPFDDEDWPIKIIVGTLISFIPFFATGYQVRVARNVIRENKRPLPGASDLGEVFIDGLMAAIAGFVYFLPLMVVACVCLFPAGVASDSDGGFTVCMAVCCIVGMALIYAIPAAAVYTMGVIRYAETGNFSEFVRLGALWQDVMGNMDVLLMLLVYFIGLGLASALLSVTVIIIPFLGFFYHITTGHLLGQAGQEIAYR